MLIVPLTLDYLDAVHTLERECYSDPWSILTLAHEITGGNRICLLALDAGSTAAGYAFMYHGPYEGHIENIAVAPAYRKRGVASLLMDALRAEAARYEIPKLTLEVRQGNHEALALYHKFGFTVTGHRREYYRNPCEDAVIMEVVLHDPKA
ncbi:MAG: ribosomal protein S18-alanine N-acetyltransferase [Defluviitaleaceae bacterium]|nr:ribosomal protein S18-alanine N-acetyltransferase [Defluviitaleaceae bacterium]MCL2240727.1 ribosomal protein S18-alanine N-acetyltransferase [Defluviitaleaceae bacterium]